MAKASCFTTMLFLDLVKISYILICVCMHTIVFVRRTEDSWFSFPALQGWRANSGHVV